MAEQSIERLYHYDSQRLCAVLPLAATPSAVRQQLHDLRSRVMDLYTPWIEQLSPQEMANRMARKYKTVMGDPNDPAYAAEIDKLINYWQTGEK